MMVVSMPLHVVIGYKCKKRVRILDKQGNPIPRKFHFNLNNYRNWHYQVSNNLKQMYKEIASSKLSQQHVWEFPVPIRVGFVLWKKDRRKGDRANVLSVHEKFFCDALVELGYLPDDSDDYISSGKYFTGGIDRENPRVDIYIERGDHNECSNFLAQLPEVVQHRTSGTS